jgi:hypothetical protein
MYVCMYVCIYVYIYFLESSAQTFRHFKTDYLQDLPIPDTGPYFDTTAPINVTGLVGKTVHLICRVKNLGNRTVSEY